MILLYVFPTEWNFSRILLRRFRYSESTICNPMTKELNILVTALFLSVLVVCSSFRVEKIKAKDGMHIQSFGAEILEADISRISDEEFDLVHDALLRHKLLIIRNQSNLTVEGQRAFTAKFGKLHVHLESSSHLPGYTDVNVVSNIRNQNGAYTGLFGAHVENLHSDLSW
jgi:hypothetical protein